MFSSVSGRRNSDTLETKRTRAEMRRAIVSGIVTGDAPVSYWSVFPVTVPRVIAKVNSAQFLFSFLAWRVEACVLPDQLQGRYRRGEGWSTTVLD